jgi:hypothetical protein
MNLYSTQLFDTICVGSCDTVHIYRMSIADIGKIVHSKNVKIPLLARRTVLQRDHAGRPCDVEWQRENDSPRQSLIQNC